MPESTVLSSNGSGQTGVLTGSELVTQVARPVGGEGEINLRQHALDCINRVRIELNQHDWRFMKRTDDAITLVEGTETYSLEEAFRKPVFACLIDSEGIRKFTLDYMEDEIMAVQSPDISSTGRPTTYMLRNDFEDGLVTVFPTPDDSAAADYRLVVEYFARIGAIADTSDSIELPEEVTNVLVLGGQAYIIREREKGSPTVNIAWADYQRAKMLLITNDRRIQDNRTRFRLGVRTNGTFGSMAIRID